MMLAIFAALCCFVAAEWLATVPTTLSRIAKETSHVSEGVQVGWTPKPTPAPGAALSEGDLVLELLKRQETSNWTNSETCGWTAGLSSAPYTCGENATCATNDNHLVACNEATYSAFFSVCVDYTAVASGLCPNDATGTGCCTDSKFGACATYLWTGYPVRSMYRCATLSTIFSMLDEPQFVVDASVSSEAAATATRTSSIEDTDGSTQVPHTSDLPDSDQTSSDQPSSDTPSSTIGIIVGGIVAMLITVVLVSLACRRCHRYQKGIEQENSEIMDRLELYSPNHAASTRSSNRPSASRLAQTPASRPAPVTPTQPSGQRGGAGNNTNRQRVVHHEANRGSDIYVPWLRSVLPSGPPPEYSPVNPHPQATPRTAHSASVRTSPFPGFDRDFTSYSNETSQQTPSQPDSTAVEASSTGTQGSRDRK